MKKTGADMPSSLPRGNYKVAKELNTGNVVIKDTDRPKTISQIGPQTKTQFGNNRKV